MKGSDAGLLVIIRSLDAFTFLFGVMDVSADLVLAVDLESGVGEAVVLCGSVGSLLGGFFELPRSGAMMLPTDNL